MVNNIADDIKAAYEDGYEKGYHDGFKVVHIRGKWIAKPVYKGVDPVPMIFICSECEQPFWWKTMHYCPNCGAYMAE